MRVGVSFPHKGWKDQQRASETNLLLVPKFAPGLPWSHDWSPDSHHTLVPNSSHSLPPVGLKGLTTIWKICSCAGTQAFWSLEEKKWRWYSSLEKENSSVDMDLVASLKAVAVLACVRGVVRILTFILSGKFLKSICAFDKIKLLR